ncbi:aminotransferase class IV [Staphylococcus intermedius]|uniref:Aminodeoxychorismate lyase n=1 Tax=Staphylococcus intermedius NCTC 11048 TaxID=1141106 RepID=A0A380GB37_STAIN|nr:aminotransferase class IV [Staphylococcus intermedius]PCF65480.1 aminodeoxychorismate lyase [Staphylococcus intermedius]PCF81158.1 aminodeoxychorismate lyase [Staphylococcus intermedius]PCF82440.1 aminodeoxychorismate lyase [Staphylococcus intermedius]PCF87140.1 aminodeoxychorismate lyase [Staphylococcus intermedius]PCF87699.1 aminodeoxychorismate lyase [Staphylococcus intermedius]
MNLFETMRLDNGEIPRLAYHAERLQRASTVLELPFDDVRWQQTIQQLYEAYPTGQYRVKVILEPSGEFRAEVGVLQKTTTMTAQFVPMKRDIPEWQRIYKTSEREHVAHTHTTQLALFFDEDTDKVLEFDIGNVVITIDGTHYTPVYKKDFLQGCMRRALLADQQITEKYLTTAMIKEALQQGGQLWMINSLREWVPITLEQIK